MAVVRKVRTPEGAKFYGQPIGSIIVPNAGKIKGLVKGLKADISTAPKHLIETPKKGSSGAEVPEPALRWQKVGSKAVATAFGQKFGTPQSEVYRLFLDYQSVGLVAKTKDGWLLVRNGNVKATASTKTGLAAQAVDLYMVGALTPDGKATMPDPKVEAADIAGEPGTKASLVEQAKADMAGYSEKERDWILAAFLTPDAWSKIQATAAETAPLEAVQKFAQDHPAIKAGDLSGEIFGSDGLDAANVKAYFDSLSVATKNFLWMLVDQGHLEGKGWTDYVKPLWYDHGLTTVQVPNNSEYVGNQVQNWPDAVIESDPDAQPLEPGYEQLEFVPGHPVKARADYAWVGYVGSSVTGKDSTDWHSAVAVAYQTEDDGYVVVDGQGTPVGNPQALFGSQDFRWTAWANVVNARNGSGKVLVDSDTTADGSLVANLLGVKPTGSFEGLSSGAQEVLRVAAQFKAAVPNYDDVDYVKALGTDADNESRAAAIQWLADNGLDQVPETKNLYGIKPEWKQALFDQAIPAWEKELMAHPSVAEQTFGNLSAGAQKLLKEAKQAQVEQQNDSGELVDDGAAIDFAWESIPEVSPDDYDQAVDWVSSHTLDSVPEPEKVPTVSNTVAIEGFGGTSMEVPENSTLVVIDFGTGSYYASGYISPGDPKILHAINGKDYDFDWYVKGQKGKVWTANPLDWSDTPGQPDLLTPVAAPKPPWWEGQDPETKVLGQPFNDWLGTLDTDQFDSETGFVYVSNHVAGTVPPSVGVVVGSKRGLMSVQVGPGYEVSKTVHVSSVADINYWADQIEQFYHPNAGPDTWETMNFQAFKDKSLAWKLDHESPSVQGIAEKQYVEQFDDNTGPNTQGLKVNGLWYSGTLTTFNDEDLTPVPAQVDYPFVVVTGTGTYVVGSLGYLKHRAESQAAIPGLTGNWPTFDIPDLVTTGQKSVPGSVADSGPGSVSFPKAGGGSLEVSTDTVAQAISVLEAAKGMMIKQPLSKADNPLWESDYHAIAQPFQGQYAGEKFHTKLAYLAALKKMLADSGPSPKKQQGLPPNSAHAKKKAAAEPAAKPALVPVLTSIPISTDYGVAYPEIPADATLVLADGKVHGWVDPGDPDTMQYPHPWDPDGDTSEVGLAWFVKDIGVTYVKAGDWAAQQKESASPKTVVIPDFLGGLAQDYPVPADAKLVVITDFDGQEKPVGWILPDQPKEVYYPAGQGGKVGHSQRPEYKPAGGYHFVPASDWENAKAAVETQEESQEPKDKVVFEVPVLDSEGNPHFVSLPPDATLVVNEDGGVEGWIEVGDPEWMYYPTPSGNSASITSDAFPKSEFQYVKAVDWAGSSKSKSVPEKVSVEFQGAPEVAPGLWAYSTGSLELGGEQWYDASGTKVAQQQLIADGDSQHPGSKTVLVFNSNAGSGGVPGVPEWNQGLMGYLVVGADSKPIYAVGWSDQFGNDSGIFTKVDPEIFDEPGASYLSIPDFVKAVKDGTDKYDIAQPSPYMAVNPYHGPSGTLDIGKIYPDGSLNLEGQQNLTGAVFNSAAVVPADAILVWDSDGLVGYRDRQLDGTPGPVVYYWSGEDAHGSWQAKTVSSYSGSALAGFSYSSVGSYRYAATHGLDPKGFAGSIDDALAWKQPEVGSATAKPHVEPGFLYNAGGYSAVLAENGAVNIFNPGTFDGFQIPPNAVVLVGNAVDEDIEGPTWYRDIYGWIDADGNLHNWGAEIEPYTQVLETFPPENGKGPYFVTTQAYAFDIKNGLSPVLIGKAGGEGHYPTIIEAQASLIPGLGPLPSGPESAPDATAQALATPGGDSNPFSPVASIAPGRYAKPGAKGWLDVRPDGTGVYHSPGGKDTEQDAVAVRKRIDKGLALTVPASSWPHHGKVSSPKAKVVYGTFGIKSYEKWNGKHTYEQFHGPVYVVQADGSVQKYGEAFQADLDYYTPEILTAQEFAQIIKDQVDSDDPLVPRTGDRVPLFSDLEQMRQAADSENGIWVGGRHVTSADDPFFDALLDSDSAFALWADQHSVEPNHGKLGNVVNARREILQSLGLEVPDPHSPAQPGRYQAVGPFWVHSQTGGTFAPAGVIRDLVRGDQNIPVKAADESSMISRIVADLGLGGILFNHKGGLNSNQKYAWLNAFKAGNFAQIKKLEKASGNDSPELDFLPDHVYWESAVPSEVPAGMPIPGQWSSISLFTTTGGVPSTEIDNYLLAAKCAYPEYLTENERRSWVWRHRSGDGDKLAALSLKAKTRMLAGEDPKTHAPVYTPGLKPAKTWTAVVESGQVFVPGSAVPYSALSDWYADEIAGKALLEVQGKYPGHDKFWEQLAGGILFDLDVPGYNAWIGARGAQATWEAEQAKIPVFSPSSPPPGLKLGDSTHPLDWVQDQHGKKWVFKSMPDAYRVEAELMATKVAKLYGFSMPEATAVVNGEGPAGVQHSVGNKTGFVSVYAPNKGTLEGVDVASLTGPQLTTLVQDHVLDWLLDNDDSRAANYMIGEDGQIIAIDKSRTMKHFGKWKGLAGDASANTNASLVSTKIFDAIRHHEISQDQAQALYRAAVAKAQKIQDSPWAPLEGLIQEGMAHRTYWYPGDPIHDVPTLLAAVKARKDQLADDIDSVWAKVFEQAGYEKPPVPKPPAKGRYIHVDPQFDVNLEQTRILGQSVMVGGSDWEEGHIHFWTEQIAKQRVVRAQGNIFGPNHKKLYQDLYDAAGKPGEGQNQPKKSPQQIKADDVRASVVDWRDKLEAQFVQFSKDHSNFVKQTDTGVQVSAKQIKDAADNGRLEWTALLEQWKADPEVNEAYLQLFNAQVEAWIDSMEKELTDAISENRVTERPPLYYPFLPVTDDPEKSQPSWAKLWNTVVDKYGKEYQLSPDDPRYSTPPSEAEVPSLIIAPEPEQKSEPKNPWQELFPELAEQGITIKVRQTQGTSGSLNPETLELTSEDGKGLTQGWKGYEYVLTLPSGEEIMIAGPSNTISSSEYDNGPPFGPTPYGQPTLASRAGMVRFQANPGQSAQSMWQQIAPVLAQLGISADQPSDDELKVLYYRMLAGSFQHRKSPPVKYQQLLENYKAKVEEVGGKVGHDDLPPDALQGLMSTKDEVAFWEQQFEVVAGSKLFAAFQKAEGWRPRFDTDPRTGLPVGHPHWYRVDEDPVKVMESGIWLQQNGMPATAFAYTGMQSTDERTRILGSWLTDGPWSPDSDQSYGSGTVVYTKPGDASPSSGSNSAILSPLAAMRIGAYGFITDTYGKPFERKENTPFSAVQMLKQCAAEIVPKWALWWGDVYSVKCHSSAERNELIQKFKDAGVTEIRGIPVEDFFVLSGSTKAYENYQKQKAQITELIASGGWL